MGVGTAVLVGDRIGEVVGVGVSGGAVGVGVCVGDVVGVIAGVGVGGGTISTFLPLDQLDSLSV